MAYINILNIDAQNSLTKNFKVKKIFLHYIQSNQHICRSLVKIITITLTHYHHSMLIRPIQLQTWNTNQYNFKKQNRTSPCYQILSKLTNANSLITNNLNSLSTHSLQNQFTSIMSRSNSSPHFISSALASGTEFTFLQKFLREFLLWAGVIRVWQAKSYKSTSTL